MSLARTVPSSRSRQSPGSIARWRSATTRTAASCRPCFAGCWGHRGRRRRKSKTSPPTPSPLWRRRTTANTTSRAGKALLDAPLHRGGEGVGGEVFLTISSARSLVTLPAHMSTIVVGGGSAGAAVAGILAERGEQVLLLEAGPDYGAYAAGGWPADLCDAGVLARSHDWGFHSEETFP